MSDYGNCGFPGAPAHSAVTFNSGPVVKPGTVARWVRQCEIEWILSIGQGKPNNLLIFHLFPKLTYPSISDTRATEGSSFSVPPGEYAGSTGLGLRRGYHFAVRRNSTEIIETPFNNSESFDNPCRLCQAVGWENRPVERLEKCFVLCHSILGNVILPLALSSFSAALKQSF